MKDSIQTSFKSPIEKSREVMERLQKQYGDIENVIIAVSGGTDSTVAADVFKRLSEEYGFTVDAITHINTGAGVPQSKLVAKILADLYNVEFIEQGYRNQRNALAPRVLDNGWPAAYGGLPSGLGHGREWANRKSKPMDEVYMMFEGQQIWVSGARKLESDRRRGNVPDNSISRDKPRRVWCSIISGWTTEEKVNYILEHNLPVSEAYLILGFSGECTGCAFDNAGLLTDIQLLSPELAFALSTLAVWAGQLAITGELDIDPKQLCWGWEPNGEERETETQNVQQTITEAEEQTEQEIIGCSAESCADREIPNWIRKLEDWQIVDRIDVEEYWQNGIEGVTRRFQTAYK